MGDYELITLKSGARAVRQISSGEVMHPAVGPWEEANALYVEQPRLADRLSAPDDRPLVIYDVGLGAAANAVAALSCARAVGPKRPLVLHSFEQDLDPLRLAVTDLEGFAYLKPWHAAVLSLLDRGEWEAGGLRWKLWEGDALKLLDAPAERADLVFFDPFSPATNPAFWSVRTLERVRARCADDALLMTYSAATPTRVALLLAGFFVGVGVPIGFKGETTIAATRFESLANPLGARWLERWERSSSSAPHGEPLTEERKAQLRSHAQWARLR